MAASKLKFASLSDPSVERFKIEHNYEFQINSRSATPDFSPGLEREREHLRTSVRGLQERTQLRTQKPYFSPGLGQRHHTSILQTQSGFYPNPQYFPLNTFCLHKQFTMKIKYTLIISVLVFTFSSCIEISNQIDDKQKQLESKIKSLDSTVNYEVERVKVIDSLVKQEKAAIDSLVKLRTE